MHGVFGAVVDVVDADPDRDEGLRRVDDAFEDGMAVVFVLGDLVDQGDGMVVVEGCAVEC